MYANNIKLYWTNGFRGKLETENGTLPLGAEQGEFKPYQLLLGSLGSCFYSTFLGIAKKKRLNFSEARMEISGKKRDEVPTTLEHVIIKMTVVNPSKEKDFLHSAELAGEYCSIHRTIALVAKIDLEVNFEYREEKVGD